MLAVKMKKAILCAVVIAVVLGGAYIVRSMFWNSHNGEPDVSDMMLNAEDGEFEELEDGRVPLTGLPGEDGTEPALTTEERYVQEVIDLINEERIAAGLEALEVTPEMQEAAAVRAEEISVSFAHDRPDGRSYKTALEESGASTKYTGENVAAGYRTPASVVKAWMDSEGHRANILNENYTKVGAGYFMGTIRAHWSLLFTK